MAGSHSLLCPDGPDLHDATPTIISNFGFPAAMSRFGASANNNGPSVSPAALFPVRVYDTPSRKAVRITFACVLSEAFDADPAAVVRHFRRILAAFLFCDGESVVYA